MAYWATGFFVTLAGNSIPETAHVALDARVPGFAFAVATVAAEVALALVLLTGAGLLLQTLWGMQRVDRRFRVDRIGAD